MYYKSEHKTSPTFHSYKPRRARSKALHALASIYGSRTFEVLLVVTVIVVFYIAALKAVS